MTTDEDKTKAMVEMAEIINNAFIPSVLRTALNGKNAASNVASTSPDVPTANLQSIEKFGWGMFLDPVKFSAAFGDQILNSGDAYVSIVNESNVKSTVSFSPGDTSVLKNAIGTKLLFGINFAKVLKPAPLSSLTPAPIYLVDMLESITLLINYDFRNIVPKKVPGYLSDTPVAVNLSRVSEQTKFTPFLNNISRLIASDELRDTTNFYAFRRILLFLKMIIHYAIAKHYDDTHRPTGTPQGPPPLMLTDIVLDILSNIVKQFDDVSLDIFNYKDMQETNANLTIQYYNNLGYIKEKNQQFEEAKKTIDSSYVTSANTVMLKNYSIVVKIVAIIIALAAVGFIGFTFSSANRLDSRTTVCFQVLLLSVIISLGFYFVTSYYALEPFDMPSETPSTPTLFVTGENMKKVLTNYTLTTSDFLGYITRYLQQTLMGANALQSGQILKNTTDIQRQDSRNLTLYTTNLAIGNGSLVSATKMIEAKQRNNIAMAWVLMGILMIGSTTMAAHTLFAKLPLVQTVVDAVGGAILLLYLSLMLFQTLRRTRRDPAKYYWQQPDMASFGK